MRAQALALLLVLHARQYAWGFDDGEVAFLDLQGFQSLLRESERCIVLIQVGECEQADAFAPMLANIARSVRAPVHRLDVRRDPSSAWTAAFKTGNVPTDAAAGTLPGAPVLKAFFRDAPAGHRVHTFRGWSKGSAADAWAAAADAWQGGDFDGLEDALRAAVAEATARDEESRPEEELASWRPAGGSGIQRRWAGREGAFNGADMGEHAYRQMMGDSSPTHRKARAEGVDRQVKDEV